MPPWTGPKIFTPSSVVSGTYFTYMPISRPIRRCGESRLRSSPSGQRRYARPRGEISYPTARLRVSPSSFSLRTSRLNGRVSRPSEAARSGGADAGTVGDQAQPVPGPRLVADGVPAVEPVVDGAAVLVTQL